MKVPIKNSPNGVLEELVSKDIAAQEGVGDPAVFLGAGDADEEEAVVAEA